MSWYTDVDDDDDDDASVAGIQSDSYVTVITSAVPLLL